MDQRRDRRRGVARVAEDVGVGRGAEALEERVVRPTASTSSRVPARQTWPASSYMRAAVVAAASRSASAKTTSGPLPPSSAVNGTRFARRGDADRAAGLRRAGEADAPHARVGDEGGADLAPEPLDDVEHARRHRPPPRRGRRGSEQLSGDHSAGLSTTVLPAASAGAVFHVESMNGAFHGVITTVGPAGMRSTRVVGAVGGPPPRARRPRRGRRRRGSSARPAPMTRSAEALVEHRHVEALDDRERLDVARRSGRRGGAGSPRGPPMPSAAQPVGGVERRRRRRRRRSSASPRATSPSRQRPVEGGAVLERRRRARRARHRRSGRGRRRRRRRRAVRGALTPRT